MLNSFSIYLFSDSLFYYGNEDIHNTNYLFINEKQKVMKKIILDPSVNLSEQFKALSMQLNSLKSRQYEFNVLDTESEEPGSRAFLFEGNCIHEALSYVAKAILMKEALEKAVTLVNIGNNDPLVLVHETLKEQLNGNTLQDYIDDANTRIEQIKNQETIFKLQKALLVLKQHMPVEEKEKQSIDFANEILGTINTDDLVYTTGIESIIVDSENSETSEN